MPASRQASNQTNKELPSGCLLSSEQKANTVESSSDHSSARTIMFAALNGSTAVSTFFLQMTVTGKILSRIGPGICISILPIFCTIMLGVLIANRDILILGVIEILRKVNWNGLWFMPSKNFGAACSTRAFSIVKPPRKLFLCTDNIIRHPQADSWNTVYSGYARGEIQSQGCNRYFNSKTRWCHIRGTDGHPCFIYASRKEPSDSSLCYCKLPFPRPDIFLSCRLLLFLPCLEVSVDDLKHEMNSQVGLFWILLSFVTGSEFRKRATWKLSEVFGIHPSFETRLDPDITVIDTVQYWKVAHAY